MSLYISTVKGAKDIGNGWAQIYVPARTADLYRALSTSPVTEMFSYDTYPAESAVAVKALVPGVRVTSVEIEGEPAVLENGKFRIASPLASEAQMNVKVNYVVYNNPMSSTYTEVYASTTDVEVIAEDAPETGWYTLQGTRVDADALKPGVYIRLQGAKTQKVHVR